MKSLKIGFLALMIGSPFALLPAIYQEGPMLENLINRWSEFDDNQKIVALDEAIFSSSGDTRSYLEQAKADLPNALNYIIQALNKINAGNQTGAILGRKGSGSVYQKPLLENLKLQLDQATTPQEKLDAIENSKKYATYGTNSALEKAKLDLDNASTIIQEELDKYEQGGVYPE